ncbi:hypothetical protein A3B51_03620 [Candidatus Curtissbacteria bacterium RIFCSPLOWO2_01_FULL_41_18]|uniref:Uncharacterized protein n=1 Tax=Candidatus Curtissbacteria bacterium RIFCSPLOWO2_01_FULL_41_18 TaxID=1797727 RepID=A0A1F5HL84_9BACT|nr:MAG: hypothetical protein A3B51_03620 [Candidatus Curtissbacteria bacterium RIFCSPLOWO2_01_FULL_41_18]OGH17813.1 MAG: hypothetical protein A2868_03090 [Candidatus Levybacteria bacterium RIFCSPHIGHO2_01_FULL_40_15b]
MFQMGKPRSFFQNIKRAGNGTVNSESVRPFHFYRVQFQVFANKLDIVKIRLYYYPQPAT